MVALSVLVAVSSPMLHCLANVTTSMLGFLDEDWAEQMDRNNSGVPLSALIKVYLLGIVLSLGYTGRDCKSNS